MSHPDNTPILDFLAAAVAHRRIYGDNSVRTFYCLHAPKEVREGFKAFLCRMQDELMFEPGTTADLFHERVRRMAHLADTGKLTE
jgi:hypothetical protein